MQSVLQIIRRWLSPIKPRAREQAVTPPFRERRRQYLLDTNRPPNAPTPFGYNMGWLALRTNDTQTVIHCLRLTDPQEISSENGVFILGGVAPT